MVPKPPGLSSTSGPPSPLQCSPRTKPLHACSKTTIQALTRGNNSMDHSWSYYGQNNSTPIYNSQITWEIHSLAILENNIARTTMSPQHTIPTAIAGDLPRPKMGKEQTPNLYMREKDAANTTVDDITVTIQRWSNRALPSVTMVNGKTISYVNGKRTQPWTGKQCEGGKGEPPHKDCNPF